MSERNASGHVHRRVRPHRDGDTAQLQALVDESRVLMNASADPAAYQLGDSFVALRGRFDALQDAATQLVDIVGGHGQQVVRAADDYVSARPWTAAAQALALGFIVGWLIAERR